MDFRQVKKDLAAAQGKSSGPVKMCLVTVIGMKLNNIVQDLDCPPVVVHSIDPRNAIPTEEQKAECLRLWAENPGAPAAYEFPADGWPSLPPAGSPPPPYPTGDMEDL
jgi:hypothetical protein